MSLPQPIRPGKLHLLMSNRHIPLPLRFTVHVLWVPLSKLQLNCLFMYSLHLWLLHDPKGSLFSLFYPKLYNLPQLHSMSKLHSRLPPRKRSLSDPTAAAKHWQLHQLTLILLFLHGRMLLLLQVRFLCDMLRGLFKGSLYWCLLEMWRWMLEVLGIDGNAMLCLLNWMDTQ